MVTITVCFISLEDLTQNVCVFHTNTNLSMNLVTEIKVAYDKLCKKYPGQFDEEFVDTLDEISIDEFADHFMQIDLVFATDVKIDINQRSYGNA